MAKVFALVQYSTDGGFGGTILPDHIYADKATATRIAQSLGEDFLPYAEVVEEWEECITVEELIVR